VAAVRAGEELTLTANGQPVASFVPHVERERPWVPASELLRIVRDSPADHSLLDDLADVRGAIADTSSS
jgi:antitoxin (DNA-binding transcriptional repressor) of toxin-antitoxin stability system